MGDSAGSAGRGIGVKMTMLPGLGERPRNADTSEWFTPPETAERIAQFAMAPWYGKPFAPAILEPSCGQGALLKALAPYPAASVTAVDISADNIEHCKSMFGDKVGKRWFVADFLEWSPCDRFDVAVMNPPFEREQAMLHILRALECCARVVAHVPLTTLAGKRRYAELWSKIWLLRLAVCATRPRYGADGGKTDMCTIEVVKAGPITLSTHVEWWP